MEQPVGFVKTGEEGKVCLLKKSLYGLRRSSRQWYKKFNEYMGKSGFQKSKYDACVYMRKKKGAPVVYLLLYIDAMLIAGPSKLEVEAVKTELKAYFDMKELGDARRILGMDIRRDRGKRKLWLHQTDYIAKVLKRFNMVNVKETTTPLSQGCKLSRDQRPKTDEERQEMSLIHYANVVGSIMYTMLCTRPDVAYAISVTSRYMSDYGCDHWNALKWIMLYLKGAERCGILFEHAKVEEGSVLVGYCDADYAANIDNRGSQTGYIFTMYGTAICWKSDLQDVVALSTTEAEYMALTSAVKESFWLKGLASDLVKGKNQ